MLNTLTTGDDLLNLAFRFGKIEILHVLQFHPSFLSILLEPRQLFHVFICHEVINGYNLSMEGLSILFSEFESFTEFSDAPHTCGLVASFRYRDENWKIIIA